MGAGSVLTAARRSRSRSRPTAARSTPPGTARSSRWTSPPCSAGHAASRGDADRARGHADARGRGAGGRRGRGLDLTTGRTGAASEATPAPRAWPRLQRPRVGVGDDAAQGQAQGRAAGLVPIDPADGVHLRLGRARHRRRRRPRRLARRHEGDRRARRNCAVRPSQGRARRPRRAARARRARRPAAVPAAPPGRRTARACTVRARRAGRVSVLSAFPYMRLRQSRSPAPTRAAGRPARPRADHRHRGQRRAQRDARPRQARRPRRRRPAARHARRRPAGRRRRQRHALRLRAATT